MTALDLLPFALGSVALFALALAQYEHALNNAFALPLTVGLACGVAAAGTFVLIVRVWSW